MGLRCRQLISASLLRLLEQLRREDDATCSGAAVPAKASSLLPGAFEPA